MDKIKVKIAKEFTATPGPRYIKEGFHSGELFRDTILFPKFEEAIKNGVKIEVDLDGTAGYGTSFLEETFGGLIREKHMDISVIKEFLELVSNEEEYLIEDIQNYIEDAEAKRKK